MQFAAWVYLTRLDGACLTHHGAAFAFSCRHESLTVVQYRSKPCHERLRQILPSQSKLCKKEALLRLTIPPFVSVDCLFASHVQQSVKSAEGPWQNLRFFGSSVPMSTDTTWPPYDRNTIT